MARFFFNIRNGDDYIEDQEGTELPDLNAARDEATLSAREILAEKLLSGEVVNGSMFEITNEEGRVVDTLPFKTAFRNR